MGQHETKPNLFLVGALKSGTSSLYYYLKQHPEIFFAEIKEPHFFCKDFHRESEDFHGARSPINTWYIKSPEEYRGLYKKCVQNVSGDASTSYLYSKVAALKIYNFNPAAKIVIIIRDPVSLLYSWHSYLLYYNEEEIDDFEIALNAEKKRKSGELPYPKYVKFPTRVHYSDMAHLSRQVKRYLDYFPSDRVKILLLNDLQGDPQACYRELLEYVGVDEKFAPDFTVQNPNKISRFQWINDFLINPDLKVKHFKKIIPKPIGKAIKKILRAVNTKEVPRQPLDTKVKERLMIEYKEEVETLSNLLKRDLCQLWGYR